MAYRLANIIPITIKKTLNKFLATRLNVFRNVRDAMDESQPKQKQEEDTNGRGCIERYADAGEALLKA